MELIIVHLEQYIIPVVVILFSWELKDFAVCYSNRAQYVSIHPMKVIYTQSHLLCKDMSS